MKKILLLSDTHSHIDERILFYAKEVDEVWHAGDIGSLQVTDLIAKSGCLVRGVYGNIDDAQIRTEFPEWNIFEIDGVKIAMTHIAGSPNKYPSRVKEVLLKERPKIFVCGHSHILKVEYVNSLEVLHMNPGAAGKHGFHHVRTMLRFQINSGKIENLEVIELGSRHS